MMQIDQVQSNGTVTHSPVARGASHEQTLNVSSGLESAPSSSMNGSRSSSMLSSRPGYSTDKLVIDLGLTAVGSVIFMAGGLSFLPAVGTAAAITVIVGLLDGWILSKD